MIETLTVDKGVIKVGEEFVIGFEDPNHPAAKISIYNALTGSLVSQSDGEVLTFATSLPEVGSYDVEFVNSGSGVTVTNRSLILVTPEETGRLPRVTRMTSDRKEVTAVGQEVNFVAEIDEGTVYNGSPCTVSRSLYMSEPYQFTVDAAVMKEYKNTSFALWFKVDKFEHASLGTLLMTKVNRNYNGTWVEKVWGAL